MIEELYTDFSQGLLRWCMALAREDRATGEDLMQETFLRALTHIGDLEDLSRGQQFAWLKKTARNLYIDRARRLSREQCVERKDLERSSFEEDFSQAAVRQLVGRLPEEERAIFILRHFEGCNATEIGEIFSLPPATVRSRLASARRRLKKWIEL